MTTDVVDRIALIERIDGLELAPQAIRLLAEGEPVALRTLAAATGRPPAEIEAALRAPLNAELDERGRLVGLGLTLRPTPHRFLLKERVLFAWCATDALMFPPILGRTGIVESTCPHSGRPIRIELSPERVLGTDPGGAVVSAVWPDVAPVDVRSAICVHGRFFASPAAAASWERDHPGGEVRCVRDAFALGVGMIERLGWRAPATAIAREAKCG